MTDRYSASRVSLPGAVLLAVTTVPFLLPGTPSVTSMAILLVARGVGMAWAQMPAMTAAYASVTTEEIGDATTLVNILQRTGGAIGAAALVIMHVRTGDSTSPAAYTWAFATLAVISTLTIASAAALRR